MGERIAIIPARGGSKGVPGKNKRIVHGRPLIDYTFDAAKGARLLDRVILSTDDEDIAALGAAAGVEVVRRPAAIAADDSPVIDAVRHALEQIGAVEPRALVLLQPTSPLRTAGDIDAALELFDRTGTPVCSVCRVDDAHPARMYRLEGEILRPLMPELASARRQDLPPLFHRNGALYVVGPTQIAAGEIICDPMVAYEMAAWQSVNIDSEFDLLILEATLANGD